jgi:hypothetical protein
VFTWINNGICAKNIFFGMNQKVRITLVIAGISFVLIVLCFRFINFQYNRHFLNQEIPSISDIDSAHVLMIIAEKDNPRVVIGQSEIKKISDRPTMELIRKFLTKHQSGWDRSLVRFGGPRLRVNLFQREKFQMAIGFSSTGLSFSEYERGPYLMAKKIGPEDINEFIRILDFTITDGIRQAFNYGTDNE